MTVFGILKILIVGFIVGLIARALMPGKQKLGMIKTAVLGVLGSLAGGAAASLIDGQNPLTDFQATGFIGSVLGAIVLLYIGSKMGAVENE